MPERPFRRLSTPRAAAVAGVLFALLFATALILIRTALPEGAEPGSQWLVAGSTNLKIAATIMPFAGIAFLWFMGVVREGLGRYGGQVLLDRVHRQRLALPGDDVRCGGRGCGSGTQ